MNEPHGMILIDVTPGMGGEFDRSFLERTGHDVVICHGPEQGELCPLLAGTGCEMVDPAGGLCTTNDVILSAMLPRVHSSTFFPNPKHSRARSPPGPHRPASRAA